MIDRRTLLAASLALLASSLATAVAQQRKIPATTDSASSQKGLQMAAVTTAGNPVPASTADSSSPSEKIHESVLGDARALRLEGEKRFHTNCGRCHVAPPKFPPRAMATILRHMRVRALITDEDRRLILRYMTE